MSSRPKTKCKGTNPPHLQVWKTPSPLKLMDPVTNDFLSVTQEENSLMSPQPFIVDESQEVTDKSLGVPAATDEEIIVAGTGEDWKIRVEVLAKENSSLKDKVKLLEEALLAHSPYGHRCCTPECTKAQQALRRLSSSTSTATKKSNQQKKDTTQSPDKVDSNDTKKSGTIAAFIADH